MKFRFILLFLLIVFFPITAEANDSPSIVFLGASNTNTIQWANGSYVTKLADVGLPWSELTIVNSGIDGVGTFSYYENPDFLKSQLRNYTTDFIFIMLGGNDFIEGVTSTEYERNLNWMIHEIRENSQVPLFLSNIIWSPLEIILPQTVKTAFKEFQSIVENIGFPDVYPVDVYNSTQGHFEYYSDIVHLNEEGHKAVATSIDLQLSNLVYSLLPSEIVLAESIRIISIIIISLILLLILSYPFLRRRYL